MYVPKVLLKTIKQSNENQWSLIGWCGQKKSGREFYQYYCYPRVTMGIPKPVPP